MRILPDGTYIPEKSFCGECDHYHNPDEPHGIESCEVCQNSAVVNFHGLTGRDRLWCQALINTLDLTDVAKVLEWFNRHRKD